MTRLSKKRLFAISLFWMLLGVVAKWEYSFTAGMVLFGIGSCLED